ncbi:MAG: hypothetical protein HY912_07360 [Desulfomonile tiedjei]|uniref:Uncharacterized protein n=1 Tax=Desulfomonile tiedjei TaxID=2358 RepID=A0A9D6V3F8_9BACT|nr:hypothetical protein [Desulfomonile tiedjei]
MKFFHSQCDWNPTTSVCVNTLIVVLALTLSAGNALSADKRAERIFVHEVPTTGKILDVEYRPEFDEWWVKCREGENIAVYSYDSRAQKWGRVQFVIKKTDEKAKTPEPASSAPAQDKHQESAKTSDVKTEPHKKPPEKDEKKKETKWWDPLNVFKGGEKAIRQPDGGK